jgi:hypothetical protein
VKVLSLVINWIKELKALLKMLEDNIFTLPISLGAKDKDERSESEAN